MRMDSDDDLLDDSEEDVQRVRLRESKSHASFDFSVLVGPKVMDSDNRRAQIVGGSWCPDSQQTCFHVAPLDEQGVPTDQRLQFPLEHLDTFLLKEYGELASPEKDHPLKQLHLFRSSVDTPPKPFRQRPRQA